VPFVEKSLHFSRSAAQEMVGFEEQGGIRHDAPGPHCNDFGGCGRAWHNGRSGG
jgi:hypothetical protein